MASSRFDWAKHLRSGIKARVGMGWQVVEQSSKVKVTYRPRGQTTRSSVVLPIEWSQANLREIEDRVADLKDALDADPSLDLKTAFKAGAPADSDSSTAPVEWDELIAKFEHFKTVRTEEIKVRTWQREYTPVMEILKAQVTTKPLPRNCKALLERMVKECPSRKAGTASRKALVGYACQLLAYGVAHENLAPAWQPPLDRKDWIGNRMDPKKDGRPVKDEDMLRLLDSIKESHPQWWLALATLAVFGLRPVELNYCRVSDCGQKLHVFYYKRNNRTKAENFKPSDVPALPPLARPDLGKEVLQALAEGQSFPPLGANNQVGGRCGQFLKGRPVWMEMQIEASKKGEKVTAYGFRHGFALRAHQDYGLSVRIAAAMMRHDPTTHNKYYGKWADDQSIDAALAAAMQRIAA